MGTEVVMNTENTEQHAVRRRLSLVYGIRLAAVLTLAAFVIMSVMIVNSGPVRISDGFFIQSIEPGSPADIAGAKGIITHVNGKPVTTPNDLREDIFNSLGEPMAWTMAAFNEVSVVQVTPLERPESGQSPTGILRVQNLTHAVGRQARIIAIGYVAYVGVALLVVAEIVAWRRRRSSRAVSESLD